MLVCGDDNYKATWFFASLILKASNAITIKAYVRLYNVIIYAIDRLYMQKKNSPQRAVFEVIKQIIDNSLVTQRKETDLKKAIDDIF